MCSKATPYSLKYVFCTNCHFNMHTDHMYTSDASSNLYHSLTLYFVRTCLSFFGLCTNWVAYAFGVIRLSLGS